MRLIFKESAKNIFVYCKNDPLKYIDKFGNRSKVNGIMDFSIGINNTYYEKTKESYYYDSSASPSLSDHFFHAAFNYFGTYDKSVKYLIPNGSAFYEHYLYGNGVPVYIDYLDAYNDDNKIRRFINQYLNQMVVAASTYSFNPCNNKVFFLTGDFSLSKHRNCGLDICLEYTLLYVYMLLWMQVIFLEQKLNFI